MTTDAAASPSPSPTVRLFVALWPTPALRRALVARQHLWRWPPGAAATPAAKLHLTLHFIGAVPRARMTEISQALRLPCPRFTLALDAAECWPNGCAVLAARTAPPGLARLHAALAAVLAGLKLPVESRALRPHVTLARKAHGATAPAAVAPLAWTVRAYTLVQSAAGTYTPLVRYGAVPAGGARPLI